MATGGTFNSGTALVVGAVVLGGLSLTGNFQSNKSPNKSLAEKINRVMKDPNVKVAQTISPSNGGGLVNKIDGNPFASKTTYHSYTWDFCEEWLDAERCGKWLDPYVSQHGFENQKSAVEGKIASIYAGMRENKNENQWAIWDIQVKGGESVMDEKGRLNRRGLAKFELKNEVKKELQNIGQDASREILAQTLDNDEPKETMPNIDAARAAVGSLTAQYRNNLVGLLGAQRRNAIGIEIPGGLTLTDCNVIMSDQNSKETQEKLFNQAPLDEITENTELKKRVALCEKMMSLSVRAVNPQVNGEQVSSGDPNSEAIDAALVREAIEAVDDSNKNPGSMKLPPGVQLTKEQMLSPVTISENGREKTIYETPKDQIEAYNQMLKKAAASWQAVSKETRNFIGNAAPQILSHQIKGSTNLVKLNFAEKSRAYLRNENVSTLPTDDLEMTPQELINKAGGQ